MAFSLGLFGENQVAHGSYQNLLGRKPSDSINKSSDSFDDFDVSFWTSKLSWRCMQGVVVLTTRRSYWQSEGLAFTSVSLFFAIFTELPDIMEFLGGCRRLLFLVLVFVLVLFVLLTRGCRNRRFPNPFWLSWRETCVVKVLSSKKYSDVIRV